MKHLEGAAERRGAKVVEVAVVVGVAVVGVAEVAVVVGVAVLVAAGVIAV